MPRRVAIITALALTALMAPQARAQSSATVLEQELDEIKQQHSAATSKNLDYLLTTLQSAAAAPDAAEKLYQDAGGKLPATAKVITKYEHETPGEQAARSAVDRAVFGTFDNTLQLHCAMMRFAVLFIAQPKTSTLPTEWKAWLKEASLAYPQIMSGAGDSRSSPGDRRGNRDVPPPAPRSDVGGSIRNLPMRDSPIGGYLGFRSWGEQPQAAWRVADLPSLYRDTILAPLRKAPTAETLAAWDVYIAMMSAAEPDTQKWEDVENPGFQFERTCDDYKATPGTEKIEALIALIKAHPDHPKFDEWVGRVHELLKASGAKPGASAPGAAPTLAPALPPIEPDQPPPPAVGIPR